MNDFWQSRSVGEKRLIILLLWVGGFAIVGQLLWMAFQDSKKLRVQIPHLQSQLEDIVAKQEEWQRLKAQSKPTLPPESVRSGVELELKKLGDKAKAEWRGGDVVVSGQVSFEQFIRFVATLHQDYGLHVSRLTITPALPGIITVEAEFNNI